MFEKSSQLSDKRIRSTRNQSKLRQKILLQCSWIFMNEVSYNMCMLCSKWKWVRASFQHLKLEHIFEKENTCSRDDSALFMLQSSPTEHDYVSEKHTELRNWCFNGLEQIKSNRNGSRTQCFMAWVNKERKIKCS